MVDGSRAGISPDGSTVLHTAFDAFSSYSPCIIRFRGIAKGFGKRENRKGHTPYENKGFENCLQVYWFIFASCFVLFHWF